MSGGEREARMTQAGSMLYTHSLLQWLGHTSCARFPYKRFGMHAIIETGGKQYRVASGDVIRVEKLAGDVGSEVELPVKAAFSDGGELVSATVKGTILCNGRGEKVLVFKFKRKKQYKKTIGHRQSFTEVKVGDIVA